MFWQIWNNIRGYVVLEVSGFSVERFINLAANRGIYLWDVTPAGSKFTMKMSAKAFRRLKGCTQKTRCKMRIIEKHGLPFFTFRYRKRKAFAAGILFFVAALFFLSCFVWVIEISGNERIKKEALMDYCSELGLKPGAFKPTLNTKKLTEDFLTEFTELSWLAIDIKGTKVKIDMVETIEAPEAVDYTSACDIVSTSNALVTDVIVISGEALVKPKDTVQKGAVLVSGLLTIKDGEEIKGYHYTHANAEIYGKVWYELDLSENLAYTNKGYTGQTKRHYAVNILDKKINLPNTGVTYANYDKITKNKPLILGGDFALPASIDVTEYSEYEAIPQMRTVAETKTLLEKKVDAVLEKKLEQEELTVLGRELEFTQTAEAVSCHAAITVLKRIDEQKPVPEQEARAAEQQNMPEPAADES